MQVGHRVHAEIGEGGALHAGERRLGDAGLGILLGRLTDDGMPQDLGLVDESPHQLTQPGPCLRDQRLGRVPLTAMEGADAVGGRPDDPTRLGDRLLTRLESGVEDLTGVFGEVRSQLAMTRT